mmetsp:Transcript_41432/g.114040  ORF Transcript_41432/g.114040 Transcript_41432/m.114040 type:complete len:365 (+) Transcript_41432:620-1714(+)
MRRRALHCGPRRPRAYRPQKREACPPRAAAAAARVGAGGGGTATSEPVSEKGSPVIGSDLGSSDLGSSDLASSASSHSGSPPLSSPTLLRAAKLSTHTVAGAFAAPLDEGSNSALYEPFQPPPDRASAPHDRETAAPRPVVPVAAPAVATDAIAAQANAEPPAPDALLPVVSPPAPLPSPAPLPAEAQPQQHQWFYADDSSEEGVAAAAPPTCARTDAPPVSRAWGGAPAATQSARADEPGPIDLLPGHIDLLHDAAAADAAGCEEEDADDAPASDAATGDAGAAAAGAADDEEKDDDDDNDDGDDGDDGDGDGNLNVVEGAGACGRTLLSREFGARPGDKLQLRLLAHTQGRCEVQVDIAWLC